MVFEKLTEILADQLDRPQDTMTMETNIAEDLDADSLDIVEMLMAVEDEFDLEIPDEDVEELRTIGDVVNYIQAHTDEQ